MNSKYLAMGAAVLLSLGNVAMVSAQSLDAHTWDSHSRDWSESHLLLEKYKLHSGFTAAQMQSAAGALAAKEYQAKYGLQPGWKEADFCRAAGARSVSSLRVDYNLMPGFTAQDYAQAYADQQVNRLIKQYHLPPNFTEDQLRQASGEDRVAYSGDGDTGWKDHGAFSATEMAAAAGVHNTREIAQKYGLSPQWDYSELLLAAGPEEAAHVAQRHGFGKHDSHAQIEQVVGQAAATDYAHIYKLTDHFTAAELISALGNSEIEGLRDNFHAAAGVSIDEAWIVAQYKAQAMSNFRIFHPSAGAQFIESSLLVSSGVEECQSLRDQYGLEPGFSEADLVQAVGESAVAKTRRDFDLPRDFTEDDLIAAEKKKEYSRYRYGCY